jgi:uncharacterized membrane protein
MGMNFAGRHLRRHVRFYVAAALGIIAGVVASWINPQLAFIVAVDTFFGTYLAFMTALVVGATPAELRKRADDEDEGILLIVVIALSAICMSFASIFTLLNQAIRPSTAQLLLSLVSAPLGWLVLHTIMALHYAHRYYVKSEPGSESADMGGLKFPGDDEPPHAWDFMYYSFVVGMTAQVSDVVVLTTSMRKLTLAHAVISFVFNTVLIALAVNVAVALGK